MGPWSMKVSIVIATQEVIPQSVQPVLLHMITTSVFTYTDLQIKKWMQNVKEHERKYLGIYSIFYSITTVPIIQLQQVFTEFYAAK
jgi:hypothetical protein